MIRSLILGALFVTTVATTAHADVRVSKTGAVSIDIPKSWKVEAQGDVFMMATDPKEEVGFVLMIVDAQKAEVAIKALDAKLAPIAKDQKWGKPKPIEHNGLKGIAMDGHAKVDGTAAEVSLLVLGTPNKKMLIAWGAIDEAKKAAHEAEVAAILTSLKPIK